MRSIISGVSRGGVTTEDTESTEMWEFGGEGGRHSLRGRPLRPFGGVRRAGDGFPSPRE